MKLMRAFRKIVHMLHQPLFLFVKKSSEKYIHSELEINNELSYKEAAIYAVNHTNVSDTPVVFHTLNKQTYILAGTKSQKLIDSIGFNLNGVVWVNRHSAKSRKKSTKKIYRILKSGGSVMWFPEGTWNLTENLLMLPMRYGIVKMAVEANVPIVPISIHYSEGKTYSRVGEAFRVSGDKEAISAITELRDIMATMKYEQMEACGVYKRTGIEKRDFEMMIKASLDEYPTFNREYEESCVYKN